MYYWFQIVSVLSIQITDINFKNQNGFGLEFNSSNQE
jgi:hypothetical protein